MSTHVLLTLVRLERVTAYKVVTDERKVERADFNFDGVAYDAANTGFEVFGNVAQVDGQSMSGLFPLAGTRFVQERRPQHANFDAYVLNDDKTGMVPFDDADIDNRLWTEVLLDGKRIGVVIETPREIQALIQGGK